MKYLNGKIYLIRNKHNDNLIYVGSTIEQYLSRRLQKHKFNKGCYLYKYINEPSNNTCWDDWYIELYEDYPCDNRLQLCKRENEIIRQKGNINKIGYLTEEQVLNYNKDYYKTNKEYFQIYMKKWKDNHKTYFKDYRINNNHIVKCDCGSSVVKYNISTHLKTKKHIDFINQVQVEI